MLLSCIAVEECFADWCYAHCAGGHALLCVVSAVQEIGRRAGGKGQRRRAMRSPSVLACLAATKPLDVDALQLGQDDIHPLPLHSAHLHSEERSFGQRAGSAR